jgi:hypothetical protein
MLAVGSLLALMLAMPLTATAIVGQYEVSACNYTLNGVNNSWVWESSDTSEPDHYAKHFNCPDRTGGTGGDTDREGGLATTDALHLSNGAPRGTNAGWTFTAPTGTTIAGINYERYIGLNFDSQNSWSPGLRADGAIINNETCEDTPANAYKCLIGGPPGNGTEPSIIAGLNAHNLTLGIECRAEPGQECITGASQYGVWAAMYGATITINDPTPPTLDTPTGSLWEASEHNGYHEGTETLTTSAQDIGGGIQTITLAADGKPLQTYTAPCDFTYTQPCPSSTGPQTFTLSTENLSDGQHNLTLTATDAAGNSTTATQQITVANNPPAPPTMLTATATQPGSLAYTATWQTTASETAPIASATYQLCPENKLEPCTTPTQAPPTGPAIFTLPSAGTWTLAVWFTNAAGQSDPSNAATIQITTPNTRGTEPPPNSIEGPHPSTNTGPRPTTKDESDAPSLRLVARRRGRRLVVRLTGPSGQRVRVGYTVRFRAKTIAVRSRTVVLRDGAITVGFKLPAASTRGTTIHIAARLTDSKYSVHSTVSSPKVSALAQSHA